MTDATQTKIQKDNKQFHSEHEAWLGDVAVWGPENERAMAILREVEVTLREHGELIKAHADETRRHETEIAGTESAEAHARHARPHAEQRVLHEKMKRQHHELMAHASALANLMVKRG